MELNLPGNSLARAKAFGFGPSLPPTNASGKVPQGITSKLPFQ